MCGCKTESYIGDDDYSENFRGKAKRKAKRQARRQERRSNPKKGKVLKIAKKLVKTSLFPHTLISDRLKKKPTPKADPAKVNNEPVQASENNQDYGNEAGGWESEENGNYDQTQQSQEASNEEYQEQSEEYEEAQEESFLGKDSSKKNNQKVLFISIGAVLLASIVVFFITRKLKGK